MSTNTTDIIDDNYVDFLVKPPLPARHLFYGIEIHQGGFCSNTYAIKSYLERVYFYNSVIDDCRLQDCILTSCIVTAGRFGWSQNCTFNNCRIRATEERHPVDLEGAEIVNCKIENAWDIDRSMKDREPKDAVATQFATYELMNNILLKEVVVDYLRHWAWRTKRKLRRQASHGVASKQQTREDSMNRSLDGWHNFTFRRRLMMRDRHGGVGSPIRECKDFKNAALPIKKEPVDDSDQHILRTWSAKKAGKRPFHINETYNEDQQLSLPLRRTQMYGPRNPWKLAEIYGGESSRNNSMNTDSEMLDEAVECLDWTNEAAVDEHLPTYEETLQMDL